MGEIVCGELTFPSFAFYFGNFVLGFNFYRNWNPE